MNDEPILKRVNSDDPDFIYLTGLLDHELVLLYGQAQKKYDAYNQTGLVETAVVVYLNKEPAGCGCFKKYNTNSVEIKRMFVRPGFRGRGISKIILTELENWALKSGYSNVVLETGISQEQAVGLYKNNGYLVTENYGPYKDLSTSICFNKKLDNR